MPPRAKPPAAMTSTPPLPRGLHEVIPAQQIARRVEEMGKEIGRSLKASERPVAVVVLQGGFIFAADLVRHLPASLGLEIGFLRCESYGSGTRSRGKIVMLQDLDPGVDLRGRTVLLIDDILDTGLTIKHLVAHLKRRGAKKVRVCVLVQRKSNQPPAGVTNPFVGFKAGREFFVGYGMDHAGRHRNLPSLAALEETR